MTHARVGEDYTHATSFSLNFRYQNHNDNLKQIDSQVFPFSSLSKKKYFFIFSIIKTLFKDKDNSMDPDAERKTNFIDSNETSSS